ncbi:unnamed protein product [Camellia sinensis]
MGKSSPVSALKAYWFPLILFTSSMFYQLLILPRSYPPSHYNVLGIKRYSSTEQVTEAYEKFSSKWNSGIEVPPITEFIKIRYAFELLTNPLWKRNYDIFGNDEHIHVLDSIKERHAGTIFSEIDLPLLESASFIQEIMILRSSPLGTFCLSLKFKGIANSASLLDGMENTGMDELGEVQLATYLAEKTFTGQPSFQNGLPSLIAFPSGCNNANCLIRYEGELSVDVVTNWFATTILSLPRILYCSKDSLVKVIFFSETGERATPFVRQAALNYWPYAAFAFVPWREEESSFWWNVANGFGVESAPAIVFLKEHGVKPVVYHGPANNSWFVDIMEQNKYQELILREYKLAEYPPFFPRSRINDSAMHPAKLLVRDRLMSAFESCWETDQELPQLRSVTSMGLGCDAHGYSRAGNETAIWYCVILAGRSSPELNKMRTWIQEALSTVDNDQSSLLAAVALKEKRLTFTWLDGEAQQLVSKNIVTNNFLMRYTLVLQKNMLDAFLNDDVDPASQLVARYNGSEESSEIIKWISQIIEDVRAKTPALVPEDADPIWSVGAKTILSKGTGMKHIIGSIMNGIHNRLGDPRIGPVLLLGALMSFGGIWLQRSQSTHPSQSNNQTQLSKKVSHGRLCSWEHYYCYFCSSYYLHLQSNDDEDRPNQRRKKRAVSNQDCPPSITDTEPKDAYQMSLSDSDSE